MRRFHSLAGLAGAVVVVFMAITGAILSLQPVLETAVSRAWNGLANTGELAAAVAAALPGVERITHSASGIVVAYYVQDGRHLAAQIDPGTGAVIGPYEPSPFFTFVTELHRSLFLGDVGHAIAGIGSVAIALLATSGIVLLVARMGGWRRLFSRGKGTGAQRLHAYLARLALVALAMTSLSGAFMSAVNFGFVPDGTSFGFAALPQSSGVAAAPIAQLSSLIGTPLSSLRELVFPAAGDLTDVFTLTTSSGVGYVDQANGAMQSFTPNNFWQQLYETIYLLDTGEGDRAEGREHDHDADGQAEVTDPVDDERLVGSGGVGGVVVPEPDQQVGRQTHAFPADVEQQVGVGQHQQQHRGHEQVEVGEEPALVRVVLHVADRVDVDQRPDEGHQQHERH